MWGGIGGEDLLWPYNFLIFTPAFQERKLIKLPDFIFCTFEGNNKENKWFTQGHLGLLVVKSKLKFNSGENLR